MSLEQTEVNTMMQVVPKAKKPRRKKADKLERYKDAMKTDMPFGLRPDPNPTSTERHAIVADDPDLEYKLLPGTFVDVPARPLNPSGIRPVEFKVLVRPIKVEDKTAGGVYIPEIAQERQQAAAVEGEIIAASPLAFTYEKWPNEADKPKAGDRVYYAKYAGMTCKGRDGVEYRLLNDKDVAAIIA